MNGLSFSDWTPATKQQADHFDHLTPLNSHPMFDFPGEVVQEAGQFQLDAAELNHVAGSEYNCGTIGDSIYCRRREETNPRDQYRYRHVLAETIWWELPGLMKGLQSRKSPIEMKAGDIDNDGDIDFAYRDLESGVIMVATQEYSECEDRLERLDNALMDLGLKDLHLRKLCQGSVAAGGIGL